MADASAIGNGNGKKPNGTNGKNTAMGISLAIALVGTVTGWGMLAQSWAKDATHALLQKEIEVNVMRLDSFDMTQRILVADIGALKENQAKILANQEAMFKTLDRLEKNQ